MADRIDSRFHRATTEDPTAGRVDSIAVRQISKGELHYFAAIFDRGDGRNLFVRDQQAW